MPGDPHYSAFVVKAWTKETLASRVCEHLDPYPAEVIVSITSNVDFQFPWPWRRNWALIVVRRPDAPDHP
ncbi:MAG: hypothetical protein ACRDK7_11945 [Solirubrobacteraceae bacterium]